MKFLSIGECMLELASRGEGLYKAGFAGDTFNTAWYIAQLQQDGITPMYLTAAGTDDQSAQMVEFITSAGITPLVQTRQDRTIGLYMISLNNGERSFSYWRDGSAATTLADDLDTLPLSAGDIAFFSGITLAILPEAGRTRLLDVLSASKAQGVQVVFDPNIRPRLWNSTEEMLDWTMKGAAVSDMCLPSFEDEADYFGDGTPQDTCTRYADNGTPIVVVKNGPAPVLIWDNGTSLEVPIKVLETVVDTTAAGDSFNAMLLASYIGGHDLAEATRRASQFSAKVISAHGALVHID